jgi:hypothetical protein
VLVPVIVSSVQAVVSLDVVDSGRPQVEGRDQSLDDSLR